MRALSVGATTAMERTARAGAAKIKLAAFDMDGVLIDHVSSWAAVHDALGTANREAMREFLEGRIDDREFILRDVELWRRARPTLSKGDILAILGKIPRMPGLREAITALRAQGTACVIVTGGLRAMGEILAREGPFDALRANNVAFGPDGRLLDEAVVEVPIRAKGEVVRALREFYGVGREETASVGDTHFDRGMFSESRVSVAFNPADEAVVAAATHVVREKDLRLAVAPLLD